MLNSERNIQKIMKNILGVLKRALRLAYTESGLLAEDIMSKVSMRSKVNVNEQKEMHSGPLRNLLTFCNSQNIMFTTLLFH